jgi:hypothetical protein
MLELLGRVLPHVLRARSGSTAVLATRPCPQVRLLCVRVPLITITPSGAQREPAPLDRIATCRPPSTGTIRRSTDPEE